MDFLTREIIDVDYENLENLTGKFDASRGDLEPRLGALVRICYLASAGSLHTQRWLRYFAEKGHDVHLISPEPPRDSDIGGVRLYELKEFRPQIRIISFSLNLILSVLQIKKLVKRIKPDILHAHYITECGFLGALSGFHPLVMSAWGSDILVEPKKSRLIRWMAKKALSEADLITSDGDNTIEEMLKLGADSNKIHLVYHGVDIQRFKPAQKNEILEKELEISESPVIISVRSLNPIYNVETVVKSVPLVLKQFPEAEFIIAGNGLQKDYLEDMAKSLGVQGHTKFIGEIPNSEIPYYLTLADVYVSTSLSEGGTSVSLAEAMSCGLAPVVTDVGDVRKWIENGKNGFVVPTKSPDLLAEKVIYLLENKELRDKIGKAGRHLVEERANYQKEMEKMEKLYEELVRRRKK